MLKSPTTKRRLVPHRLYAPHHHTADPSIEVLPASSHLIVWVRECVHEFGGWVDSVLLDVSVGVGLGFLASFERCHFHILITIILVLSFDYLDGF